jgi:hypothetical protein
MCVNWKQIYFHLKDIEREINICKDNYIDNTEVNKKRFKQMAASINDN